MFAIMRRPVLTDLPRAATASRAAYDGQASMRDGYAEATSPGPVVWYVLDGAEFREDVPPGQDMWSRIAAVVGRARRCDARADEPPSYDTGTRNWTLMIQLATGRRGRTEELAVPVRWQSGVP